MADYGFKSSKPIGLSKEESGHLMCAVSALKAWLNYDIADGLRAIDEAVNYLSLRSGCRLGHATMLGILPKEFYAVKNPVSMPSQIFLDNVVWMYFFIRENSIHFDDVSHLLSYLKEKFGVQE